MNKKILAFGASNSRNSINKQLANYAAHEVTDATVTLLDLNDFGMPIYGIDREKEEGVPQLAKDFRDHIAQADGIVISFAEHNGSYAVAFKNIFDWVSRIEKGVWMGKPLLLMATSPGGRGGKTVLDIAVNKFKYMNAGEIAHFCLPFFRTNFSPDQGILDAELKGDLEEQLRQFEQAMKLKEVPTS